MTNLSKRVEKGENLVLVKLGGTGTTSFSTTGSTGNEYQVHLFRKPQENIIIELPSEQKTKVIPHDIITVSCQFIKANNGKMMKDCQGNSRNTICYHCLAAIREALSKRNQEVKFFDNLIKAWSFQNWQGGKLTRIQSKNGHGAVWALVKTKSKKVDNGNLEQRVNSLRGNREEEEGID